MRPSRPAPAWKIPVGDREPLPVAFFLSESSPGPRAFRGSAAPEPWGLNGTENR